MRVLQLQVSPDDGAGSPRGVSAWVATDAPEDAARQAIAALAQAGWRTDAVVSNERTDAEDYFRPCPSHQAFLRAQSDGVAWRFDDD